MLPPRRPAASDKSAAGGATCAAGRAALDCVAMAPDLNALTAFAHRLADEARALALPWFRTNVGIEQKDDRTPVTAADRAIERCWRERIAAAFPDHGILGEEEGPSRVDAEWLWVLDPIDGTKAFASGNPLFGCLVGLMHRGVPVLGVLEAPALGERWHGTVGGNAVHARAGGAAVPIRVRPERPMSRAVLYCTTPDPLADDAGFAALRREVQWTSYGGDCISYALVAMGTADLVVDRGLKPYDWCALVPILAAAGGVLCDWRCRPLTLASSGDALAASCPGLAASASARLRPS